MSDLESIDSAGVQNPGDEGGPLEAQEEEILELTELIPDEDGLALEFLDEAVEEEEETPIKVKEELPQEVEAVDEDGLVLDEDLLGLDFEDEDPVANGIDLPQQRKDKDEVEEVSFKEEQEGIQMGFAGEGDDKTDSTIKMDEPEAEEAIGSLDFTEKFAEEISLEDFGEGELDEFVPQDNIDEESFDITEEISLDEISLDEDTVDLDMGDDSLEEGDAISEISLDETEELLPPLRSEGQSAADEASSSLEMVDEIAAQEISDEDDTGEIVLEGSEEIPQEIEASKPDEGLTEGSTDDISFKETPGPIESDEEFLREEELKLEEDMGDVEGGIEIDMTVQKELDELALQETAEIPAEMRTVASDEKLRKDTVDEVSHEGSPTMAESEEKDSHEKRLDALKDTGIIKAEEDELEAEVDDFEMADGMEPEEDLDEDSMDLDYLSLREAAGAPLEFEDTEFDHGEPAKEPTGDISPERSVVSIRAQEKAIADVSLPERKTIEGPKDQINVEGAFGGEEEITPHIKGGRIPLEEIPLSSLSISPSHFFLALTLGDFGISEPLSDGMISDEMTKSIHEIVEKITTSLAPPIVERVVREIALKRSEEIIKEEIERIKGMDRTSPS